MIVSGSYTMGTSSNMASLLHGITLAGVSLEFHVAGITSVVGGTL